MKKNNHFSKKAGLLRVAAFLTAALMLLAATACGEETGSTVSENQLTEVKVEELDADLTGFLTVFTDWYYRDYGEKLVYDSAKAGDGETNILRSIIGNASCADWSKYPVSQPTEVYNAKKLDPKKWAKESGGAYMTYETKDADWIAVNIFNVTEDDLKAMREQGEENKWFYADGDKYYVVIGGVGDPLTAYTFDSAKTDGTTYYVDYTCYFDNGEERIFNGSFTADLRQKTIDGKTYWTLVRCEQTANQPEE